MRDLLLLIAISLFFGCSDEPSVPQENGFVRYPNSLWSTPIADYELADNSAEMVQFLYDSISVSKTPGITINYKKWTAPIHFINSADIQRVSIKSSRTDGFHESVDPDGDNFSVPIPLPTTVWADSAEDGHMILVDTLLDTAWEFSFFEWVTDDSAVTSTLSIWDLQGEGYLPAFEGKRWWRAGSTGAGISLLGGIVTFDEFSKGVINHPLICALPTTRKVSDSMGTHQYELVSPPACRSDGRGIGLHYIPEGVRMVLNPALNLDSLGLSSEERIVATALQRYGAFVCDGGAGFSIRFENRGSDGEQWESQFDLDMSNIPFRELQVLDFTLTTK